MKEVFVILLCIILICIYKFNFKEKFMSNCWIYGDDYNGCYSNSNCTIGFLPDGSTHCMKKFLYENI